MIHNDKQYGRPFELYTASKATIEALTGVGEGALAYATDSNELGTYDGSTWHWGQGAAPTTHYELVFYNDEPLLLNHDGVFLEVDN